MVSAKVALSTLVLLLAQSAHVSDGAKILGVFPIPSSSHQAVMTGLAKELAAKGHEVTVIIPMNNEKVIPNYRVVGLNTTGLQGSSQSNMVEMEKKPLYAKLLTAWYIGRTVCGMLNQPTIQEFIHSKDEEFDAIIVESFFNECMLGFSHKFQAPIIQLCSFGGGEWLTASVGMPHNYAYMPDFMTSYNQHMTFFQRVHNTIVGITSKLGRAIYYIPQQNEIMQKAFAESGPGPMPHISELESKTAMVLMNQHFSLGYPRPLMPNAIEVGGLHIKPPKKLPKDLQEYLDAATEGVVYFSMGSYLKSANIPVKKRAALFKAVSKLKVKVLCKWDEDNLPGKPKNLKLEKWLPQSDLLAHPNVKVFITHGGLLSTQESVYHGVPVIGIPIFADQHMNIKNTEAAGYGYFLDFKLLDNEEDILKAINTVLFEPKYRENAQRISRIFQDQPLSPLGTAVFWTEYVIRHKGAPHMRSGALDLSWYQYYLLDILAVTVAGALLARIILRLALKGLCGLVRKKAVVKDTKKRD